MPKVKTSKGMKVNVVQDPRKTNVRKVTTPVVKSSKVKRFGISNLKRETKELY